MLIQETIWQLETNVQILVSLDGKLLNRASPVKFLGITVDQNLNWFEHINHFNVKYLLWVATVY